MLSKNANLIKTAAMIFFLLVFMKSFSQHLGIFSEQTDVGKVLHEGAARYDAATEKYIISGSGDNIWFGKDAFHFVWKKMQGDFILRARGNFLGKGVEAHRKFGWMIRQNLDSSAAMVAAVVHGNGLTSLQYRKAAHEDVAEKQFSIEGPDVVQLERRGNQFIMAVAHFGDTLTSEEISNIDLTNDVYVGLFVCSHNKNVTEEAMFDNVRIVVPAPATLVPYQNYLGSHIEILDISSGERKMLYSENASLQAPNWSKDGSKLIYNKDGKLYTFDFETKKTSLLPTGDVKNINNDHVISLDGKMIGISAASPDGKISSTVYTMPIGGGTPKRITPQTGLSYLHGWSPDGKWLTYTAKRNNDPTPAGFDIYKISVNGGSEIQLTNVPGLDDGPEFSPDGKYIYFNSVRSGSMQLWRMNPDGSEPEQMTNDNFNNWFPHVSPDGQWIAFISFGKDVKADDHPFYKHVYLRLMPADGGSAKVIAYVYGGQGTMNTPSWSPDGKKIAFVSNSDFRQEK